MEGVSDAASGRAACRSVLGQLVTVQCDPAGTASSRVMFRIAVNPTIPGMRPFAVAAMRIARPRRYVMVLSLRATDFSCVRREGPRRALRSRGWPGPLLLSYHRRPFPFHLPHAIRGCQQGKHRRNPSSWSVAPFDVDRGIGIGSLGAPGQSPASDSYCTSRHYLRRASLETVGRWPVPADVSHGRHRCENWSSGMVK